MKIGTHANEELTDIIARKRHEIDEAGFSMWGYGGNTCHPVTMVQPFAREFERAGDPIILVMHPMQSHHFAEPVRAEEFSIDGMQWSDVPSAINVLGSRYALCIAGLEEVESTLDLAATTVALGRSKGKPGNAYVQGRVDKACLQVTQADPSGSVTQIGVVAKVVAPYAVLLRNRPSS